MDGKRITEADAIATRDALRNVERAWRRFMGANDRNVARRAEELTDSLSDAERLADAMRPSEQG